MTEEIHADDCVWHKTRMTLQRQCTCQEAGAPTPAGFISDATDEALRTKDGSVATYISKTRDDTFSRPFYLDPPPQFHAPHAFTAAELEEVAAYTDRLAETYQARANDPDEAARAHYSRAAERTRQDAAHFRSLIKAPAPQVEPYAAGSNGPTEVAYLYKAPPSLSALQVIVDAIDVNDSDTLSLCYPDEKIIWTASGSWSGSKDITLGDLRKIAAFATSLTNAPKLHGEWIPDCNDPQSLGTFVPAPRHRKPGAPTQDELDILDRLRIGELKVIAAPYPDPSPSPHVDASTSEADNLLAVSPTTAAQFCEVFTDHGVKLPLTTTDDDLATLVDADGNAVLVVDVDRERSDEDAAWIAGMILVAVNTCGGFKALRRPATKEGQP